MRAAAAAVDFAVTQEFTGAASPCLTIVVGENHAATKVQSALAAFLADLRAKGHCDLVLVEGSSGPIAVPERLRDIGAVGVRAYWDAALENGDIAGYEHALLVDPTLIAIGVEDMVEKARLEIELLETPDHHVTLIFDQYKRGLDHLTARTPAPAPAPVSAALDQYRASLQAATHTVAEFAAAYKPIRELMLQRIRVVQEIEAAKAAMGSDFEAVLRAQQALGVVADEFERLQTEGRELVTKLSATGGGNADSSIELRLYTIGERLRTLEREAKSHQDLTERVEREHSGAWKTLVSSAEQLDSLSRKEAAAGPALQPLSERVDSQLTKARDGYFTAANAILDAGVPESTRRDVLEFFAKDSERLRTSEQARIGPRELARRDAAMVKNAVVAIEERSARVCVLIVGSHHIEGITAGLRSAGQSFLVALPKHLDDALDPWEERAWERRRQEHSPAFAKVQTGQGNKEIARLLRELWVSDQAARYTYFKNLRTSAPSLSESPGGASIYDIADRPDVVVRSSPFAPDRNAPPAPYILESAPNPNRRGEWIEVIDRRSAREFVRSKSTGENGVLYVHSELAGGRTSLRVITPKGEIPFVDLLKAPPKGADRRWIVAINELPMTERAGARTCPVISDMRTGDGRWGSGGSERGGGGRGGSGGGEAGAGGGGGGGGGGDHGWTWSAFDNGEPRKPKGPRLIFSSNPERALAKLKVIDQMKPPKSSHITFVDDAELSTLETRLRFTPATGEYSHTFVIVARNTTEFRAAIRRCAESQLLVNKQVALVSCGDAFVETQELVEQLLNAGALMVWRPNRLVSPKGASLLKDHVRAVAEGLDGTTPMDINELMEAAIRRWYAADPASPDLAPFLDSMSTARGKAPPAPLA